MHDNDLWMVMALICMVAWNSHNHVDFVYCYEIDHITRLVSTILKRLISFLTYKKKPCDLGVEYTRAPDTISPYCLC